MSKHSNYHFLLLCCQYPAEAPEFSADLPVPLTITWTAQVLLKSSFLSKNLNKVTLKSVHFTCEFKLFSFICTTENRLFFLITIGVQLV